MAGAIEVHVGARTHHSVHPDPLLIPLPRGSQILPSVSRPTATERCANYHMTDLPVQSAFTPCKGGQTSDRPGCWRAPIRNDPPADRVTETQTRHVLASVSVQRLGLTSGIVDKYPTTSRRLD